MKKLITILVVLVAVLAFVSVAYAQDNTDTENDGTNTENNSADTENDGTNTGNNTADTGNEGTNTGNNNAETGNDGTNTGNNNAETGNNDANTGNEDTNTEEEEEVYNTTISIGLRGLLEFSALNYVLADEDTYMAKCQPVWGDLGLTIYYEFKKDMLIGFDFNYTFNGLMNFHFGYLQDFMNGPVTIGLNATAGYDLFIDKDGDTGHGIGVQVLFVGGYKIARWIEIGGDVGINFATIFSEINGKSVTVMFINIPIRIYLKFHF